VSLALTDRPVPEVAAPASTGSAVLSSRGRWLAVDAAFCALLGRDADSLVGTRAHAALFPDSADAFEHVLQRLATDAGARGHFEVAAGLDGRPALRLQWQALPCIAGTEPQWLLQAQPYDAEASHGDNAWAAQASTAVPASGAGRQTDDVRSVDTQSADTQTIETLRQQLDLLSYGISHDLRAPLRAIAGFSRHLQRTQAERMDEDGRAQLARIQAAALSAGGLIDALLELSRASTQAFDMAPVDASMLAEWVGAELRDGEPARDAVIEVAPGLEVIGDEHYLKQLLAKLMHNAWKFSASGERVRIQVSGERAGDRLALAIRDHGIGFDNRYADRMFAPFQRLHSAEQGGGNGLGLAVAQRIAERHGGKVWARSERDAGSTFFVDLPAGTL
jgi:signal transduction histidine kinase